ncbi:hypothetical protein SEPCBS119000_004147 [Sporothrix epigloea]|uniref:Uncharacterized protein n=1 Tax=Sporothrix epigloea TaxID=1892477 RepID=A0ABP0DTE4_9PEZI
MAFHQPTRPAIQRPAREQSEERDSLIPSPVVPAAFEESQTWVLFSPAADTATTYSTLDSLPETSHHTAGRSRLSDLGSLRSLEPSNYASSVAQAALTRPAHSGLIFNPTAQSHADDEAVESDDGLPDAEEDIELDSLDSHLPDFRSIHNQTQTHRLHSCTPVTATTSVNLPTHDGLGSFRIGDTVGMSAAVQKHLYSFEQFNPRRVSKRRRESLDLAQLRVADEFSEVAERTRRIEAWRWEHSRVLLEEIQKETRRRRGSELSARRRRPSIGLPAVAPEVTATDLTAQFDASRDWHDQEEACPLPEVRMAAGEDNEDEQDEGFWSRIARKFMLEFMGIDDRILSVLFGEDIAGEEQDVEMKTTPMPPVPVSLLNASVAAGMDADTERGHEGDTSWQLRLLERIARELGIFVHSHMNAHPGAFSTFTRVQNMPLPYAGLPVIPESTTPVDLKSTLGSEDAAVPAQGRERAIYDVPLTDTTATLPYFKPTMQDAPPMSKSNQTSMDPLTAARLGENTAPCAAASSAPSGAAAAAPTFTQEEWEQDLDVKLIFRYLRSRLFSGSDSASNHTHRHHSHHHAHHSNSNGITTNAANMQEAAAKVARVRQHHPLVGRGPSTARLPGGERRPSLVLRNLNAPGVASPLSPIPLGLRHSHGTATSCASHSTRRSARRSSVSSRHSSRHYWDIGGSLGTGSVIASAGPMGSWGEA